MGFRLEVAVMHKTGVLNPPEGVILNTLNIIDCPVEKVRFGKYYSYESSAETESDARKEAQEIFTKPALNLTNYNIETFRILSVEKI